MPWLWSSSGFLAQSSIYDSQKQTNLVDWTQILHQSFSRQKKVEVKSCAKLYISSTINCLEVRAHKWGLVCSKMINHWLNHGVFSLPFQFFRVKMHSKIIFSEFIILGIYNFEAVMQTFEKKIGLFATGKRRYAAFLLQTLSTHFSSLIIFSSFLFFSIRLGL